MGIKPLELDSDNDNIIYDTLINDSVGRNKYLWKFACFCSAQESRCSIALDGGWGTGKTFFLKQLQMLFCAHSAQYKQTENEKQRNIQQLFEKYADNGAFKISIQPHACVYYDAWKNDNAEDPLCSILYTLINNTKNRLLSIVPNEKIQQKLSRLLNRIQLFLLFCPYMKLLLLFCEKIEKFHILHVARIARIVNESSPVCAIEQQKRFYKGFSWYLKSLIPKENERLIFFVDELDRCKPTYAVQLLERIKHYFSNERITFVFAINEDQLKYTIEAFYGNQFDAYRYLSRFFDFRQPLPKPDLSRFNRWSGINEKNKQMELLNSVCDAFVDVYQLNLRDITRFRLLVKIVCGSFRYKKELKKDPNWKLAVYVIIPIMLGLKVYDRDHFEGFINGKDNSPLRKIVDKSIKANMFINNKDNPFAKNDIPHKPGYFPELFDTINSIYGKIFNRDDSMIHVSPESSFSFDKEIIDAIFQVPSLMADFITYDTNTEETAHG